MRKCIMPLLMVSLATGCAIASTDEKPLGKVSDNLWLTGNTFPDRQVPVCWEAATMSHAKFGTHSVLTMEAVGRSWLQSTGLRFTGWDECEDDEQDGTIVVRFEDDNGSSSQVGYISTSGTNMKLDPNRTDFSKVVIHEFGHALGFSHEMRRPDFPDSGGGCSESNNSGDDLHTPPDFESIMASTYCQQNVSLTYWDKIGSQNAYGHPNYFADVTGDGRADAILVNTSGVVVRPATSTAFGTQATWISGAWAGTKGTFFEDVTGDGKADIIGVDDDGIYVRPSSGSSFAVPSQQWTSGPWYGSRATFFADVTGDGMADAIGIDDTNVFVRPSTGTAFATTSQDWSAFSVGTRGTFFADVTGDGKADAIRVLTDGIHVRASTGTTFSASSSNWTSAPWYGQRTTALVDINGDGKADAVAVDSDGIYARTSTGSAFAAGTTWISSAWYGERGTFFADVSNDGKADVLGVDEGGVFVRTSNGTSFPSASQSNYTGAAYYADGP